MRGSLPSIRRFLFGRQRFHARQDLTLDSLTAISALTVTPLLLLAVTCPGLVFASAYLYDNEKAESWLSSHLNMNIRIGSISLDPFKSLPFTISALKLSRVPGSLPDKPELRSYDLLVDRANVRFSLLNYLNGKGWISSASIAGVSGTLFDPAGEEVVIPTWEPAFGEFQLKSFSMSDLKLNVLNYGRPYNLTVSHAHLPKGLRSPWLFHDFITAQSVSGAIDGRLFNLHTPVSDSTTSFNIPSFPLHLLGSDTVSDGTADLSAIIVRQANRDKLRFTLNLSILNTKLNSSPDPSLSLPTKAILVRFINSNQTLLPVRVQFDLPISDFYASWSAWDSGLYTAAVESTFKEISRHVNSTAGEKVKDVGLWSMKEVTRGLLIGFRDMVDPLTA